MLSSLFSASRNDATVADQTVWSPERDAPADAPFGSFWAEATSEEAAIFWQTEAAWAEFHEERESFGWSSLENQRLAETQAFASHEDLVFNGRSAGGISVLRWDVGGAMHNIANLGEDLGRMLTLDIVQTGGVAYLLGVSREKDMLVAWRILDDDRLIETSRVDFGERLGLHAPREMTVRQLGDVPYMLIVGENERAPGVLAMDPDGRLHLAEALLDLGVLPSGPARGADTPQASPAENSDFGLSYCVATEPTALVPSSGPPMQVLGLGAPGYAPPF
ncbi:hypothetical protein Q4543_12265 [Salipiger sp. 1_MG-2023]|uniref:hypothetical protein n=1 Tax=Salipiger sp. 1_MG-2023 TaxID=3062665 RepID=UPI0026E3008E|nr:hypothetical protein [Salipiger sp. 1_MG-2023]MDO6586288.1 hypothetical protein [Salipiger sp. 1_MG-2023]